MGMVERMKDQKNTKLQYLPLAKEEMDVIQNVLLHNEKLFNEVLEIKIHKVSDILQKMRQHCLDNFDFTVDIAGPKVTLTEDFDRFVDFDICLDIFNEDFKINHIDQLNKSLKQLKQEYKEGFLAEVSKSVKYGHTLEDAATIANKRISLREMPTYKSILNSIWEVYQIEANKIFYNETTFYNLALEFKNQSKFKDVLYNPITLECIKESQIQQQTQANEQLFIPLVNASDNDIQALLFHNFPLYRSFFEKRVQNATSILEETKKKCKDTFSFTMEETGPKISINDMESIAQIYEHIDIFKNVFQLINTEYLNKRANKLISEYNSAVENGQSKSIKDLKSYKLLKKNILDTYQEYTNDIYLDQTSLPRIIEDVRHSKETEDLVYNPHTLSYKKEEQKKDPNLNRKSIDLDISL